MRGSKGEFQRRCKFFWRNRGVLDALKVVQSLHHSFLQDYHAAHEIIGTNVESFIDPANLFMNGEGSDLAHNFC